MGLSGNNLIKASGKSYRVIFSLFFFYFNKKEEELMNAFLGAVSF